MATKTSSLSIRMDARLKHEAELLFDDLGIPLSTAMNLFLRQAVRVQGIPFPITREVPNAETLAAMREVLEMEKSGSGKVFHNIDDLRKDLLS